MKARILVIEDEPAINNLLCMNLEVTGYQTVSYLDGNDASEGIAWDHEFQCALVDIMLPGKDGYTLLPELNHYGIPVIFISIPFALLKAQNVMKKTLAYCSYLFIIVP